MEKKNIDFVELRRMAPGHFTEDMLDALKAGIHVEGYQVNLDRIELGDDPFQEKVEAVFSMKKEMDPTPAPRLYFTFSSAASVKQNLAEFAEFVREHVETAATPPHIAHSFGHGHGAD